MKPNHRLEGAKTLYLGRELPRRVKVLGGTSFFQDVASEMVYPLLPGFMALLGGGATALGVMESVAEGVLTIVKGAAGRASDRVGHRKPFVSAGYGLSAALRPAMAIAGAVWHVVALRGADRLAKGLRTAPRDAMIAEATDPSRRAQAFSFHRGLDHLGAAVGPLLAALVLFFAPKDLRLVFLLATIPALAGWLLVQLGTKEKAGSPEPPPKPVRRKLSVPPALRVPLAAFFLFSLGNASDIFLLARARDFGYTAIDLTLLWSGFHVAKWLASAPSGKLADRFPGRGPILAGWLLYALVYLGFAFAGSFWALPGLFLAYALFYGLTEGAERAFVVRLGAKDMGTGTVLGAFHVATGFGLVLASILFGVVWQEVSAEAAFLLGAGLAAGAGALLAVLYREGAVEG